MLRKILLNFIFSSVFFVNSNAMPLQPTVQNIDARLATVTIRPTVDIVFKNVFGVEKNKSVLIHFLNNILNRTGNDSITDLSFLNTEIPPEGLYDKYSRLDVLVQTANKETINIEIQVRDAGNIVDRSLYYASKIISQSLSSGQSYQLLPKCIMINLLGYRAFNDERAHRIVELEDIVSHERYTDRLELHFIELPKYGKVISNGEGAWIAFLKDPNNAFAVGANAPQEMTQARETLLMLQGDNRFYDYYAQRSKDLSDHNSAEEKARAEGRAEGREAAIYDIARWMKANGYPISQIVAATHLTEERIQTIQ